MMNVPAAFAAGTRNPYWKSLLQPTLNVIGIETQTGTF
jgi:hypothetical protein